jgi:hypothetical protein
MKIKLMAEYGCSPIWDITENISKNILPENLSISKNLKLDIIKWADMFEQTLNKKYPPDSGFKSLEELNSFEEKAKELIKNLKNELGNEISIIYVKTSSIQST